jgi:hypothetical protein
MADDADDFEEETDEETEVPVGKVTDDSEDDEDEEEEDPDDVEADLDAILKDRIAVVEDDEDEEEEEVVDTKEDGEGGKVRPRAPGEFVCQSCFLVKHPSQLADAKNQLCADCV